MCPPFVLHYHFFVDFNVFDIVITDSRMLKFGDGDINPCALANRKFINNNFIVTILITSRGGNVLSLDDFCFLDFTESYT